MSGTQSLRQIAGVVEHGNAWGRVIGFPTANIVVPGLLAHRGIWTALVHGEGLPAAGHLAAVSVGTRPTYYGDSGELLLEAHLIDFSGDLYGRRLSVDLHEHLRPEVQFADTESLIDQLRVDVERSRQWHAAFVAQ